MLQSFPPNMPRCLLTPGECSFLACVHSVDTCRVFVVRRSSRVFVSVISSRVAPIADLPVACVAGLAVATLASLFLDTPLDAISAPPATVCYFLIAPCVANPRQSRRTTTTPLLHRDPLVVAGRRHAVILATDVEDDDEDDHGLGKSTTLRCDVWVAPVHVLDISTVVEQVRPSRVHVL